MMANNITHVRIANSILQRSRFKGAYVIVEGNNDYTLYRKLVDDKLCKVETAFGNANVINVIEELEKRGFKDAIGLIDADFRVLDNDIPRHPNIFISDEHDLELMIFKSAAFDTLIAHYAQQALVDQYKSENENKELREIFLRLAAPLGYLKWANKKSSLGLVFKPLQEDGNPLNISDFISSSSAAFAGNERMVEVVLNYTRGKSYPFTTKENALVKMQEQEQKNPDLYHLCNGHDVINIVCISLRRKLGRISANDLPPHRLETELIFAYDSRHFEKTKLFQKIRSWEQTSGKGVLNF